MPCGATIYKVYEKALIKQLQSYSQFSLKPIVTNTCMTN